MHLSSELVFPGISEVILTGKTDDGFELTLVQLSRRLVFQGVSRLYTPVKPTIFEIDVGAFAQ